MARRMADVVARPRRGRRARPDRPPLPAAARGVVAGRARRAAALPVRVAWSPTLGYAPVDDEVRAACEARRRGHRVARASRWSRSTTVFDHDPVDEWLTLTMAYNLRSLAAARGLAAVGAGRPAPRRPGRLRGGAHHRARPGAGRGRLPRAEPPPGRALPRRAPPAHPDVCGPAASRRRSAGRGLINGAEDFNWVRFTYPFNMTRSPAASVMGGALVGRAAHRAAAGRPPARRPGRHPLGRRARGRPRPRRGGAARRLTCRRRRVLVAGPGRRSLHVEVDDERGDRLDEAKLVRQLGAVRGGFVLSHRVPFPWSAERGNGHGERPCGRRPRIGRAVAAS